jgi:hypothetical protein
MQKAIAFLLLTTMAMGACKKHAPIADRYVTLGYKQTYCADPWKTETNDSLTLKNVADYLKAEELYIASLDIKQETTPEACFACSCKTGKNIYVTTLDSETLKAKYFKLGFK